jgi:hypothetical protein
MMHSALREFVLDYKNTFCIMKNAFWVTRTHSALWECIMHYENTFWIKNVQNYDNLFCGKKIHSALCEYILPYKNRFCLTRMQSALSKPGILTDKVGSVRLTSLFSDWQLLVLQWQILFFTKQAILTRRSTVLTLLLQQVFHVLT